MKSILLIGNGKLGKALTSKLLSSGFFVDAFDKVDLDGEIKNDFSFKISSADFIFICAPTFANREILEKIKYLSKLNCIFVSFSKGMDENGNTASEILEQSLKDFRKFAVIGGPMLSGDIEKSEGVVASIGSDDYDILKEISFIFEKSNLQYELISDARAVSFFGILKNIYAFGFGLLIGLKLESNKLEILLNEAQKEMIILCKKNNFDENLPFKPVGIGDLKATAFTEGSSNRALGLEVANSKKPNGYGESLSAFKFLRNKFHVDKDTLFLDSILKTMEKNFSKEIMINFLKEFNF